MTSPLVSVVIPVFDGEAFLAQAIESVFCQSYDPVELIVVDDGSTDESADILASYRSQISVVRQANAGVAAARNAGIERARGEVVAFLDQDDWWLRDKLARQMELFQQDKRVGLVYTAVTFFDDCRRQQVCDPFPDVRHHALVGDCYEALLLHNPLVNSSVAVRRDVLKHVGGCSLDLPGNTVQDYDLWLRVARRCRLAYIDEPLTVYRLHTNQGHHDHIAMFRETLAVLLRERSEADWQASADGRRRLADLHDALAVAYRDANDASRARYHFAKALLLDGSPRRLVRLGASCLPARLVNCLR